MHLLLRIKYRDRWRNIEAPLFKHNNYYLKPSTDSSTSQASQHAPTLTTESQKQLFDQCIGTRSGNPHRSKTKWHR